MVRSERKDKIQLIRYRGTLCLWSLRESRWGRMLSKPPLMSRKRVEAFMPAFWEEMTSCLRERTASAVEMLGREPHWLGFTKASEEERE